jgi:hypothetical protein
MEYKDMWPHQQRVVDEMLELNHKIAKLNDFIGYSPLFVKLDGCEQSRLHRQIKFMCEYSDVLQERIDAFKVL